MRTTLRLFLLTNTRFADYLCRVLSDETLEVRTDSPFASDALYVVYATSITSRRGLKLLGLFMALRRPIIIHWIGTDVCDLIPTSCGDRWCPRKRVRSLLLWSIAHLPKVQHLAGATHLGEELAGCGIRSIVVPIPYESVGFQLLPLPERPAVLSYVPESRSAFYGLQDVLELARLNPDVTFHIVGHTGQGVDFPQNVIFHGWVDAAVMDKLYRSVSCVLRLVKHDALGGTVLEGVSRGRYAIWSYHAPYVYPAKDLEQAHRALGEIKVKKTPNATGAQMVTALYGFEKVRNQLRSQLALCVTGHPLLHNGGY